MESLLASVMLSFAVIPLLGFIFIYGIFFPWSSTGIGRILMTQKVATTAYLLLSLSTMLWGDWEGRDFVRYVIIYPALILMFWSMFITILRVYLKHRNDDASDNEDDPLLKEESK